MSILASLGLNAASTALRSPAVRILTALALLAALAAYSFGSGYNLAEARGDAAVAALRAGYAEAVAVSVQSARRTEQDLRSDIDAVQAKYQLLEEAASREAIELNNLVSNLRDGTRRLSVRVQNCAAGSGGASNTAPSSGGGSGDSQRAELDPATAEDLIGIARDGDRYIRERNACVEAYEAVRRRLAN